MTLYKLRVIDVPIKKVIGALIMKEKPQINIIGSIIEDLIESIRDFSSLIEYMQKDIEVIKEKIKKNQN